MGALVAAVNKKGQNVVPSVISMLNELKHRGKDGHGIATANSLNIAKTLEELVYRSLIVQVLFWVTIFPKFYLVIMLNLFRVTASRLCLKVDYFHLLT